MLYFFLLSLESENLEMINYSHLLCGWDIHFLSAVCEWQQCMENIVFVYLELPGVSVVFINAGGISDMRSTEMSETTGL